MGIFEYLGLKKKEVQNATKKQPKKKMLVADEFTNSTPDRISKFTVDNWRCAIMYWEEKIPDRELMYDIYSEVVLDSHVASQIESRIDRVINKPFEIIDEKGEVDEEATTLFSSRKWFFQYMQMVLKSVFWGHNLIELGDLINDRFPNIKEVNRYHVHPEKGTFTTSKKSGKEFFYREDKTIKPWVIEAYDMALTDKGLLVKICLPYLYKKWCESSWESFIELFGQPLRVLKTNTSDEEALDDARELLDEMAGKPWAILDRSDEMEFLHSMQGINGKTTYEDAIRFFNEEISKAINHQTMTTENGSSRSQSEVHERTMEESVKRDCRLLTFITNDELIPRCIELGMPIKKGSTFRFVSEEKISKIDQAKIDESITKMGVKLTKEYIEKTYNVEVEEGEEPESIAKRINNIYK